MEKILRVPVAIVGGGVIGLACGIEIAKKLGPDSVYLFEKNSKLGQEQSSRNSGVVHSGIYYDPGWLKSRLCVEGNRLIREFCRKYEVPFSASGKLIVAKNQEEAGTVEFYRRRAEENGVRDAQIINQNKVNNFEPNVICHSALYSPDDGVIDAASYMRALERLAEESGVVVLKKSRVAGIVSSNSDFLVSVETLKEKYDFRAEAIVNAAGLYAEEIARMVNPGSFFERQMLRGEYNIFNRLSRKEIFLGGTIVNPPPRFLEGGFNCATLGVHLTPTFEMDRTGFVKIGRDVLVGPTADVTDKRDDYGSNVHEPIHFLQEIQPFFPGLKLDDLNPAGYCGIRAKFRVLPDDFILERDKRHQNCIHCFVDSPGLTSSLAIGRYVCEKLF